MTERTFPVTENFRSIQLSRAPFIEAAVNAEIESLQAIILAQDAKIRDLEAVQAKLENYVNDMSEYDCHYNDNCPREARHYQCDACKAREVLKK